MAGILHHLLLRPKSTGSNGLPQVPNAQDGFRRRRDMGANAFGGRERALDIVRYRSFYSVTANPCVM
jgi:hypothetical protein